MNLLKDGIEKGYVEETKLTKKISVNGKTEIYPVYRIKLDQLYYNDKNDRIATWISKYKKENNVNELNKDDIENYNKIIQKFIYDSNPNRLEQTKTNIKLVKQREAGVVLNDGRIIDGNRRFTCLRMLFEENDEFGFFEATILDISIEYNFKEIKKLELTIQHGEDRKVDYDPIDRIVGVYNDVVLDELLTIEEYSRCVNLPVSDIRKRIDQAQLMIEFLEYVNAENEFYIARELDLDGVLTDTLAILSKCKDEDTREDMKYIIFSNIIAKPVGDLTRYIRKIKDIVNTEYTNEYIEEQEEVVEEILEKIENSNENNIIDTIKNDIRTDDKIVDTLSRAIEKAETKNKQKKARNEPLSILETINFKIENIDTNIFGKLTIEDLKRIELEIEKLEILKNKLLKELDNNK